jgi:negative regulator of sigma E activity
MSGKLDITSELERRTRAVLEESLTRIDARTRSRLNRARHGALEAARRPRSAWRGLRLVPVTGGAVAAAVLAVAVVLLTHQPAPQSKLEGAQPSFEVLDMLADEDNVSLMEDYDHSFYEWAAAQGETTGGGETSSGSAGG